MSLIQKKFLSSGAVAKLLNNVYWTGRNAADTADVNIVKVNASDKIEFASLPQATGTPSASTDLVNKTYADSLAGANASLSNLTTTSINQDLLASGDGTKNLGSQALRWLSAFFENAKDASGVIAVDITNRVLKNSSGTTVVDFSGSNAQTSVAPSSGNDICNKTYVDSVASNQKTWAFETLTLTGTDITNQYIDLAQVIIAYSSHFIVNGTSQIEATDYTVSLTGGAGGKTRISFAGDLATGGAAALQSGDVIHLKYQY